jgi:hypothetical protein
MVFFYHPKHGFSTTVFVTWKLAHFVKSSGKVYFTTGETTLLLGLRKETTDIEMFRCHELILDS